MKTVTIPGLERGLKILEFLTVLDKPASFTEINQILPDANRATLSRLLKVLISLNYLDKSEETGLYTLGEKMTIYSCAGKKGTREKLIRKYEPMMKEITTKYNISTILFERTGNHLTSIHKVTTACSLRMQPIGNTMDLNNEIPSSPWYTLLIACDPKVNNFTEINYDRMMIDFARKNGYSCDNQMYKKGMVRLNFPIFNQNGRMIACLGIGAVNSQMPEDKIKTFAAMMKKKMAEVNDWSWIGD